MPKLDKLTYFSQFFWFCLLLVSSSRGMGGQIPSISRYERIVSKFIGKFFFSGLWTDRPYLIFIFISLIFLGIYIVIRMREAFSSTLIGSFSGLFSFFFVEGPEVASAMENPPGPGPSEAGPSGSAAGKSAEASTPSSSFFNGLSGQIPAPDSPGEEVPQGEQPRFDPYSIPEVPLEHVFGAVPDRGEPSTSHTPPNPEPQLGEENAGPSNHQIQHDVIRSRLET